MVRSVNMDEEQLEKKKKCLCQSWISVIHIHCYFISTDKATQEKIRVEEKQRTAKRERQKKNEHWIPR